MTDHPILFSAPMIRAILREVAAPGTSKTQTRRILKPQPKFGFTPWLDESNGEWMQSGYGEAGDDFLHVRFAVGDRLWVRENLRAASNDQGAKWFSYAADGADVQPLAEWRVDRDNIVSIHMPRWASRITLEVTDVRIERLQGISEADALAEGIRRLDRVAFIGGGLLYGLDESEGHDKAVGAFNRLWRSINGDGSWAVNPWVVAISFRPILANIDTLAEAT